ncbi:hypothetical protein EAH69_10335 [Faecalibacter macacae]|uniref:Uncharacterized protein n=1 Tax=Faecalibacter macacae TaxID=1859289 RepID=A0A3L9M707_9FLAO|nr:hypothetical protein EAH69_10335 [Faecalibacter macacae]
MTNRLLYLILFFFLFVNLQAQEFGWQNPNFRQENHVVTDTIKLYNFGILTEKFQVFDEQGNLISNSNYSVDFSRNEIYFHPLFKGTNVTINYFINPQLAKNSIAKRDSSMIVFNNQKIDEFHQIIPNKTFQNTDFFKGLNSKGSLVRGIRFGNNQSGSVQSSLDLELSGNLSEDLTIKAAISDNNVPIETDGYTQKLQDFDKVFIEIANKNSKVRAGHIDINHQDDFYNRFTQKVTGLQLSTRLENENSSTDIFTTGSVTRGEFKEVDFIGQDGNQGPYRLTGQNNELYVIVLSGSEKVFIDGVQLIRGETNDYVINYNTGEITFTTNRLITSNTRIHIEYLYNSRNYSQIFLFGGIRHQRDRFKIAGHFYSQSDAKNNSLGSDLSDDEKEILANAGNDRSRMYSVSAVLTDFDSNKILYRKIDQNGNQIFEYSANPDDELYQVTFTYMGNNQGNYRTINATQNGKVFEYVEPIAGIPQGDYEPIKQLVAPKKSQVYTINSRYDFKKNGFIQFDGGLSNNDFNLFSSIDDENNVGLAGRILAQKDFQFKDWKVSPIAEFDFMNQNYYTVEGVRNVEFARDFNISQEFLGLRQTLAKVGLNTDWKEKFKSSYRLSYLDYKDYYQGFKNELISTFETEKDNWKANLNHLSSEATDQNSNFLRYDLDGQRKIGKKNQFWVGIRVYGENNEVDLHETQSKSPISFKFNEFQVKGGWTDSIGRKIDVTLYTRKDDSIRLNNWVRMQNSQGIIFNSQLIQKADHQLGLNFHYRKVNYEYENSPNEAFMVGNVKWYKALFHQGLTMNVDYGLGSGVEPQREFQYVKVADGMGIYKWTDYNGDGIEQLDEFEIAEFIDQANYIRVYTNTVQYLKTNKNEFNFSVRIRPQQIFQSKNKFVSRWSFQQVISATNSLRKEDDALEWNPFTNSDLILGKTRNVRSMVYFNQGANYKWLATYTFNQQANQTYVYTGAEARDMQTNTLLVRYNINPSFHIQNEFTLAKIKNNSDLFASRRFELENYKINPKLTYQYGKSFSASLFYSYQNKENITGIEELKQSDLGTEIQWNEVSKMSLLGSFSFVKNAFIGNGDSVVGNQMMEGLRAGNNMVWQLQVQRQINSFLQLNISYDGRKTEANKAIHTGSVQLQARF